MPRTLHSIQTNFTAGELSPRCYGRIDVNKYNNGARSLQNWIIQPQGGLTRRMGSKYIAATQYPTKLTKLVEFAFSTQQAYVLEFGNLYVRFYKQGGQIQYPPGTPVTLTTPWSDTDLALLTYTQSADVLYVCHPNYPPYQINRYSDISWTLTQFVNQDGPYLDENKDVTISITCSVTTGSGTLTASSAIFNVGHVGSLWRLEEAFASQHPAWASSECFQEGRIVTANGHTYRLTGGGAATNAAENRGLAQWQNATAYPTGYYCKWGQNCYVSTTSGTSGNTPPTWAGTSTDGGVSWEFLGNITGSIQPSHTVGTASDGNCDWLYLHGGSGYVEVTGFTDSENVTVNVLSYVPDSCLGGTIFWREGAWSTYRGFPSVASFFQQRVIFGATNYQPQTFWMSETGNFVGFQPNEDGGQVVDTTPITFTIASGQVNKIEWLSSGNDFLIGTSGGEFMISTTNGGVVSPTTIIVTPQAVYGSVPGIRPLRIGAAIVFVQRGGLKVREFIYAFTINRYDGNELSLLAEHIPVNGGGIVDACYQQFPNSVWYGLLADGTIAACTYLRDQQVSGWTRIIAGGSYNGGNAFIEAIACIPSATGQEDQLWAVVKRTINGSTVKYVEQFQTSFLPISPSDSTGMWFVDAGISYSGSPTTSITGVNHLIGQSVQIIADGAVLPNEIVDSGGNVTIAIPASNWTVGLEYDSLATTMAPEGGGIYGTAQGKRKRTNQVDVRMLNTLGFNYGSGSNITYAVNFRQGSDLMGVRPPLFTGDKRILLDMSYVTDGNFTFGQSQPYPCTITAVMPEIVVYE